ncbi:MAG TPA: ABC transporter substrate-binding protein [Ktedonobacterales bacterium]|nr:ABC transporter substrate-binding protein [Ktedonobacterales bacterium]
MGIGARGWLSGVRLVAAIAVMTAACSPTGPGAPAAPAASGAPVQLKLWISGTPELDAAMNKILQQFQTENPNVTVTLEDFPFAQYYEKLTTAFAGGSGPDVYWIDIRTAEFAKRGALLPLDKYVTPDWLADVIPVALQEGEWNGKRYSVPMHELANGIFVNKALFAQAGIPVPHDLKDAWTWSQLRDIGLKLTDRSGGTTTRWGFGSQRDIGDWVVLPYLGQNGAAPLAPDGKKASGYLDSPASIEALTWWGKLYSEDKIATATPAPDAFPTGSMAMIDAVSTYVIALQKQYPNFAYDIAPAPQNKQCAVMTGGFNAGINSATTQPDLSWKLVDYMTRVKHAQWADDSGYLPDRKSVVSSGAKYNEQPWKLFLDELNQCGIHRPASSEYSFFADTFQAMAKDISGGADVKASVAKATSALDQRLATAN